MNIHRTPHPWPALKPAGSRHPAGPLSLLLSAAVLLGSANVSAAQTPAPLTLNRTRQLFLDNHLVAQANNLARTIHPARKHAAGPVLWDPQAGGDVTYGSVIWDQGKYRMWYARGRLVCYAEGPDGVSWTMPMMDHFKIDGRRTNVLTGRDPKNTGSLLPKGQIDGPTIPYFSQLSGVTMFPDDPDPAKRYRMGFISIQARYSGDRETMFHKGERRGFGVAVSADGYRWTVVDDWATETVVDGPTYWMYDEPRKTWVHYGRTKFSSPEVIEAWGLNGLPSVPMTPAWHDFVRRTVWGRAVTRIESPDLIRWNAKDPGKGHQILTADVHDRPGTETYAMQVFPYQGLYIGMIKVWRRTPEGGPFEIQLAVSRDGFKFERVGDRSPFIAEGGVGKWDRFNVSTFMNDPIVVGDEMRIYYSAQSARHAPYRDKDSGNLGSGVGFASVPRDRFVSLAASFDGGMLTTKPLRIEGRTLHLNAKADFGEIVVEVLGADGQPVARSKPWRADSLDGRIEWETGGLPSGGAVVLRFGIRNAHLFSFWAF